MLESNAVVVASYIPPNVALYLMKDLGREMSTTSKFSLPCLSCGLSITLRTPDCRRYQDGLSAYYLFCLFHLVKIYIQKLSYFVMYIIEYYIMYSTYSIITGRNQTLIYKCKYLRHRYIVYTQVYYKCCPRKHKLNK